MQLDLEGLGLQAPIEWLGQQQRTFLDDREVRAGLKELLLPAQGCLSEGFSPLPGSSGAVDDFPCIANELEQQAKLFEDDLGALMSSQFFPDLLEPASLNQQHDEQRQRQQADASPTLERQGSGGRPAGSVGEQPCTPQRHSNESSWGDSPVSGSSSAELEEVQSPARVCALAPSCIATRPPPRPPLGAAILNAQRVRLGREPTLGAWRGCSRSAWCSCEPRHCAPCDRLATVPGLLAYPQRELFASGVNVQELCRLPEEAPDSPPAPDTESEGEGGRPAADCLSSGKRRSCADADDCASHSRSGQHGADSSDGGAAAGERLHEGGSGRDSKRSRGGEVSSLHSLHSPTDELPAPDVALALMGAPALLPLLPPGTAAGLGSPLGALRALHPEPCATMVPVELPLRPSPEPGSEPPQDAPTEQGRAGTLAPPVPSLGAYLRNLGRPAGAPRLRPLPAAPPPPAPGAAPPAATTTPSKPVTRQKNHSHTPAGGATPALRASGRRTVTQWHTESVVDPRTGATVTAVHPGTFCTQCYALSTPVWRAGPFGLKTLCNACGVRWMKYAKGSKK